MRNTDRIPNAPDHQKFFEITDRSDAPVFETQLKPVLTLTNHGFVWVISLTAILFLIPLMALFATIALWVLLPFLLVTLGALWYFIRRNDVDRQVSETIKIWPNLIAVHRKNPRKQDQFWTANPYWVKMELRDTKLMENYLTLTGNNRKIEIGTFLSPNERLEIHQTLEKKLKKLHKNGIRSGGNLT